MARVVDIVTIIDPDSDPWYGQKNAELHAAGRNGGLVEDRLTAILDNALDVLGSIAAVGFDNTNRAVLRAYVTAARIAAGDARHDPTALREPDSLDEAMHTVYLDSGKWRWTTSKMTFEAREAAVNAVLRYDRRMKITEPDEDLLSRDDLAWWEN